MSMELIVKRLGRALHDAASEIETDETHDHAEQQANFGAAKAVRALADTLGYVVNGTEDFSKPAADVRLGTVIVFRDDVSRRAAFDALTDMRYLIDMDYYVTNDVDELIHEYEPGDTGPVWYIP